MYNVANNYIIFVKYQSFFSSSLSSLCVQKMMTLYCSRSIFNNTSLCSLFICVCVSVFLLYKQLVNINSARSIKRNSVTNIEIQLCELCNNRERKETRTN